MFSRTQLSTGGRGHVAKGAEQAYQLAEFVRLKLGLHSAYHRLGDFGGLVDAAQAASAEFWARHGVQHPLGKDFSGAPRPDGSRRRPRRLDPGHRAIPADRRVTGSAARSAQSLRNHAADTGRTFPTRMTPWAPDRAVGLKAMADEAWGVATRQNQETANTYVSPMVSGYYR